MKDSTSEAQWSPPDKFSTSIGGLANQFSVHRWNNTLIAINGHYSGTQIYGDFQCYFLGDNGETWTNRNFTPPTGLLLLHPVAEATGRGVLLYDWIGYTVWKGESGTGKAGKARFVFHEIGKDLEDTVSANVNLKIKNSQLSEDVPGIEGLDIDFDSYGIIRNADIYLPYGANIRTPNNTVGLFKSTDRGQSWGVEKLFRIFGSRPTASMTGKYIYLLFRNPKGLWYSRKRLSNGEWETPKILVTSFAYQGFHPIYVAVAEDQTIHLCWMDRRHEKIRFRLSLTDPREGNYEVYYCSRNDTDADWNKQILLSKGMVYSFDPAMAVEGNKVVVAWSGAKNGKSGFDDYCPNDIWYSVSNDNGLKWRAPIRVTNLAKDGFTAGKPRVALHKGIIHLWYIQGKLQENKVAPGLRLLNQPPWDIMYQHRDFPGK